VTIGRCRWTALATVGYRLIAADTDVIAASAAFEAARPWIDTYPTL